MNRDRRPSSAPIVSMVVPRSAGRRWSSRTLNVKIESFAATTFDALVVVVFFECVLSTVDDTLDDARNEPTRRLAFLSCRSPIAPIKAASRDDATPRLVSPRSNVDATHIERSRGSQSAATTTELYSARAGRRWRQRDDDGEATTARRTVAGRTAAVGNERRAASSGRRKLAEKSGRRLASGSRRAGGCIAGADESARRAITRSPSMQSASSRLQLLTNGRDSNIDQLPTLTISARLVGDCSS